MTIFLDTNVLLDVLQKREPFYTDSARVWTLAESGEVKGLISALSLPNLYYIMRREKGAKGARKAIVILRDIFTIVGLDSQILNFAMDSAIVDVEDGIQFFSALRGQARILVTRNVRDFPTGQIAIQTPAEFLATYIAGKQ